LPDDVEATAPAGATILAASLAAGTPHCHECNGNARCSTCRVLVVEGLERCPPRNASEQAIADRLRFPDNVRLACQTPAVEGLVVRRLVLDELDAELTSLVRNQVAAEVGREQRLAILFLDIRGFTSFSERLLPYDVMHFLRRFFARMSAIVGRRGGVVDNYMGDGMLALFGVDDAPNASMRAVEAGRDMLDEAERMKPYERALGDSALEIGVGIHVGDVVVGVLGTCANLKITAIGDAVNMASRIESANKVHGTRMLVSDEVRRELEGRIVVGRSFEATLAGKTGAHRLHEIAGVTASTRV
jgi:adenylate cyclase